MTASAPVSERRARFIVWASAFGLFAATLYPSWGGRFEWGDAAKWQYIGSILGLSHPPGSPLYVLVTYVWSLLPLPFEMAVRMNLFSAVAGSLAVLTVFTLARRVGLSFIGAGLSAIALALSLPVWVFSTEAEVYSLAALMNALALDRAIAWHQGRRERNFWLGCGAWLFGIQDHLTLTLQGPALWFLLLATQARLMITPRWWLRFTGLLALSLLPLVWVWFRATSAPYSEWEGDHTWPNFLRYVLAKQYGSGLFDFSWRELFLDRPGWVVTRLGGWVGYGVVLLAPVGLASIARTSRVVAMFLALAITGPLFFFWGARFGDPMGFGIQILPGLVVAFGAAVDGLAGGFSSLPVRSAVAVVAALFLTPSVVNNGVEVMKRDHLWVFDREVDGDKSYRWDLPCLVSVAEPGATIIVPWGDYGTRQVASYHQFAEPKSRAKHLDFRYLEDPGYYWAEKRWHPDPAATPIVWVVGRNQAARIRNAGYSVKPVELGPEQCGPATRTFRMYRATAIAASQ